jgi:MraZ protein
LEGILWDNKLPMWEFVGDAVRTLLGTHELSIDSKGRLVVPSAIVRQLTRDGEVEELYVMPGRRPNTLHIVPRGTYEKEVAALPPVEQLSDAAYDYVLFLRSNSEKLRIDDANRVLIPDRLLKLAGLTKEVALCGIGDRLELWDRAEHAEFTKRQWQNFAKSRAEVMSEIQAMKQNAAVGASDRAPADQG